MSRISRCLVYVLILSLCLPGGAFTTAAAQHDESAAHVLQRLNSLERQAAIEEMAQKDAAMRAGGRYDAPFVAAAANAKEYPAASAATRAPADAPRSLPSLLLDQAASFLGVPAPMQPGVDEGLGFHQDGTVRKAGGAADRPGLWADAGRATSQARDFSSFDPMRMAQDRALSWGVGFLNSSAESLFSGLVDNGRARLNFTLDRDGHFQGEGDVLLPFHDGRYTTVFTQIGARSMAVSGGEADGRDRWIGNFGLGQRWFPNATEKDSGDWMIGYNAFFDKDFTRSHQRGSLGVELRYDWLQLASNYYFPLSGWKGSYDFDSRFIEERPAQGWDARVKAYLPFYRNLALTGAHTQWYGDHVGMFGYRTLEKDPRVWSYGLEYTPVPLVSGFINQRSTGRGKTDTEFGLNFTYHFGMPFKDQISPSKVAELRTVSGSRHEFVDRENRIILEYRAKNSYRIEYMGPAGPNLFRFRVLNGFDEFVPKQTVHVTAHGGMYLAEAAPARPASFFARAVNFLEGLIPVKAAYAAYRSKSYVTDGQGDFLVELEPSAPNPTTVTIRAGDNEQAFTLNGTANNLITITASSDGGNFTTSPYYSTASLTAEVKDASGAPVSGATVTWSIQSAQNNSPAMVSGWGSKKTGLTWGATPEAGLGYTELAQERILTASNNTSSTNGSGETIMQLTDIVGERVITVKATVVVNGTTYSATRAVSFGNGPLSVFRAPVGTSSPWLTWDEAYQACNNSPHVGDHTTGWSSGTYVGGGKMPSREEMQKVSNTDAQWGYTNPQTGQGASFAAGWPDNGYWAGEASSADNAFGVGLGNGSLYGGNVSGTVPVGCRR